MWDVYDVWQLRVFLNESSAELHGYTNSTQANTKCTRDIIMKYNYKKSGETKYLNIGSDAEVTALDGKLFQRGITVCKKECCR